MIERCTERDLGLAGFGPEMAMYRAFLARTGLHALDSDAEFRFDAPNDIQLQPAWEALTAQFDRSKRRRVNLNDVFAALRSPPIGMKSGAVPVFVTAGLLAHTDDVALYEHGTFRPVLTPELSERMVRNPAHFDIKAFANTTGARREVVEKLTDRLGVRKLRDRPRVANVVAVVAHLVSRARRLDNYTRRTASLAPTTCGVRDALLSATEPDELLFSTLPSVLGFDEIAPGAKTYTEADAFAAAVSDAVEDLEADGGGPFDALRVTVTCPDGTEYDRLVGVDHRRRSELQNVLNRALDDLADYTGSKQRAEHALLALLGERLLSESAAAGGTIGRIGVPDETPQARETRPKYG